MALTSRPSNLRGRQGTIVIDEAAFHDQLSELLKAALAMLIWGGRVRVISTHNGTDNAFNELVEDIRAKKRKGTVHRITFQDAVADACTGASACAWAKSGPRRMRRHGC